MSKEGYFGTAIELLAISAGVWLQMTETIPLIVGYPIIALCAIGGVVLIIIGIRKKGDVRNIDNKALLVDIKSDLITMNALEREVATDEAQKTYPKEVTTQVAKSFGAMFGDPIRFAISITKKVISNRDVDPLIEIFKKFGDILDSINYGLKRVLADNEQYELTRTDLAQKRLQLKKSKKKNAIIQKNIDRVIVLIYGLNSSIIIRAILRSLPETKNTMLTPILVTLEGIEVETEKVLNKMLDDLGSEWKARVNSNAV